MSVDEMRDLVPLYALDALEYPETTAFEAHLSGCSECQDELDAHRTTMSTLVTDEAASDFTWDRISAVIDAEATATVVPIEKGSRTASRWVASVAAAAALIVGGFLVAQLLDGGEVTNSDVVAAAHSAANEDGAIVSDFLVDEIAVAQVVVTKDGRGYVIPSDDLEALDSSLTYQLWVINDTEDVISAGVLGAAPAPATFTWTGDITGFALTREVAGGVVSSAGDVVSLISEV